MFVGQLLYLLGIVVAVGSAGVLVLSFFSGGGALVVSALGILNGLIAIGVGDLVIQSNHERNVKGESKNSLTAKKIGRNDRLRRKY